ncbi:type 3 dihydrofolate reductase [Candidatus Venteria ishoeyi]|uniref:type 3 dihydrofolate reductase n=1 Tax=Candidatus Venteria ishoeyi TaxID=1899563 RepID=UPI0025A64B61|nr:type 3 dihydrofolate reductase [Candidatus Venteria ishoeyi]MDM8547951.1 type 3 dihydrofolate reductase [Candidatus Venteria ishoeyi]
MHLSIIAALSKNRVIGLNQQMPWHLPADLAWFKQNTLGKPIVMGRKTFESIGRPLPGRDNIVLSRDSDLLIPGCQVIHQLQALEDLNAPEIMIIGGGQLYAQTLPLAERLYLTEVQAEFEGDTYFPVLEDEDWQEVSRIERTADEKNPQDCIFCILAHR